MTTSDELIKLAQLRDSGVLTDGEFAVGKARLLGINAEQYVPADGDDDYDDEDDLYDDANIPDDDILPAHSGAFAVKVVFLGVAILVHVGGIVSGIAVAVNCVHHQQEPGGTTAAVTVAIILGSLIAAPTFAFFAYVIDLLVEVDLNTRVIEGAVPAFAESPNPE